MRLLAYADMLYCSSLICKPCISGLYLILHKNGSRVNTKRGVERGRPCLIPLDIVKGSGSNKLTLPLVNCAIPERRVQCSCPFAMVLGVCTFSPLGVTMPGT